MERERRKPAIGSVLSRPRNSAYVTDSDSRVREAAMANREQRKNKEKKKPKAEKTAKQATTSTSPFAESRNQKPSAPGKK